MIFTLALVVWHTVYREIFAVNKILRLSVTAKISRTKFFLQRNTVTVFLMQEVRCHPQYHPRRLLQQIKKWKKPSVPHLVGNVGHTGSIILTVRAEIVPYSSTFLHVLNFRGRPVPRKFYSVKFFHANFYNTEISRYTVASECSEGSATGSEAYKLHIQYF